MTTETWLDLRNVEAWQGDRPVLHELNLQLKLRQSTTVLGPNGAGKSSLVKLIDRSLYPIVRPDAHLRLFGSETVNLWALRSRLGVVSSELEQRLHPKTAVEEVVVSSFFGATRLGRDQDPSPEQRKQARDLLDQLQLNGIRERCGCGYFHGDRVSVGGLSAVSKLKSYGSNRLRTGIKLRRPRDKACCLRIAIEEIVIQLINDAGAVHACILRLIFG